MAVHLVSKDQLSLFRIPFAPVKVAFDLNCDVFEEGNKLCRPSQKQLIVEEDSGEKQSPPLSSFECIEPSCEFSFSSVQSCEVHYACAHRYVCFECKCVLPSQSTLDVHIRDTHTPYDVMSMGCKTYLYSCFIPLCARQFSSLEERNEHMISDHKYPPDFKFGLLRGPKKVQMEKMDTSSPSDNVPVSAAKYKSRVPHSICFGRGSSRAFKRKDVAFSHPSNRSSCSSQNSEMEAICMADLQDALP